MLPSKNMILPTGFLVCTEAEGGIPLLPVLEQLLLLCSHCSAVLDARGCTSSRFWKCSKRNPPVCWHSFLETKDMQICKELLYSSVLLAFSCAIADSAILHPALRQSRNQSPKLTAERQDLALGLLEGSVGMCQLPAGWEGDPEKV